MSNSLRLPTMRQLEKMDAKDAGMILDIQERELEKIYNTLPHGNAYAKNRRNVRQQLYRVRARRIEFFGK